MKKRLLSLVLAVCMALGSAAALPEGVFSESTSITASAVSTATSGKCGDNVKWSLKNGVLTISGKGGMTDYVYSSSPFYGRTDIKSVVIKSGVTSIGSNAFRSCTSLTSVTIPNSVTSFSSCSAFECCRSLKSITIPNGVKDIGQWTFYHCTSLKSVTIPSSVKTIDFGAFEGCTSLKSVTIPSGVKEIDNSVFYGCTRLTSITIPNSVTSIDDYAFEGCTNLTSVKIPSSVTRIGDLAFSGTKWLENQQKKSPFVVVNCILIDGRKCKGKVTIPSSVKSIGESAFSNCSKLTGVTIPKSVTSIDDCAFSSCSNLTSVTIPGSVISIGGDAFWKCTNLKTVTIQKGVQSIDDYAFKRCTNLTSVTIPDSVINICKEAFYRCTSLKNVTIPSSVKHIGDKALGYSYDNKTQSDKKVSGFTIYGVKGTAAQKYAKNNGFKFVAHRMTEPKVSRFAGANRYETASIISKKMNPKTSGTVIIATGLTFHDAMVAVPLAKAYNAPLLLATEKQVTKQTEAELKRLKAKNVIVISTNGAIGAKAKAEFKALKYKMTYIEGKTCFETAAKVAKALQAKTKKAPDTIFFATDSAFADALSASPVAAIKGAPIIYLKNAGSIDKATADYLKSVKSKVKNAYVIGGSGVISDAMMKNVATALGLTVNKTVQRVAGKNRYETCVAVNNKFKSVLSSDGICVAKGLDFPDALAGGVYAASTKQALFLADGKKLQDCQNSYLKSKNAGKITVFGGTGAVPDELVKLIAKASV